MKYRFFNPITNSFEMFDTQLEAESRLVVVKADYIKQEEYRFPVAKEIIGENSVTWAAANLENDEEDYVYQVFNHLIGQHEAVSSLSQAKARNQALKDEFIAEMFAAGVMPYEEENN
jgi:hypothetical protein